MVIVRIGAPKSHAKAKGGERRLLGGFNQPMDIASIHPTVIQNSEYKMKFAESALGSLVAVGFLLASVSAHASLTSLSLNSSSLSSSIHSTGGSSNSSADVSGVAGLGSSSFADTLAFGGLGRASSGSFMDTITFSLSDLANVTLSGSFSDAVVPWSSTSKKGKVTTGIVTTEIDSLSFILSGGNLRRAKVFEFEDGRADSWNLSNLEKGIYTLKIKGSSEIDGNPLFAGRASYQGSISAVAAVPEPEEWTMMLVGFALLGFQVNRKAKQHGKGVLAG
jgi:hypothetical protein